MGTDFVSLGKSGTKLATGIAKTTLKVGALAAAAGAAASTVGGLVAATGAMLPALALLPAAAAAGSVAIATLVVGFQGLGDAMSATDPEEFAAAMEKLSPAARDVVTQLKALGPAAHQLRLDVQERLWSGLGTRIRDIGNQYLPILSAGMGRVASSLNGVAQRFANFLQQAQTLKDTKTLFDNTAHSINNMAPGIQSLLEAFRDIGTVASGFLPGLAAGFSDAAKRFADFIAEARKTGQLQEWIKRALQVFKDLWQVIKDVGVILFTVFDAANTSGTSFFGILRDITGQIRAFLTSAKGATFLQQIFGGLRAILDGIMPVLKALGDAFVKYIAPAIQKLGPIIGEAFAKFAPAVDPVMRALGELLPILGEIASTVAGVLSKALQKLAPFIPPIAEAFAQIVEAAAPLVDVVLDLAVQLLDALMPILPDLVDLFKKIVDAVKPLVEKLGPVLVDIFKLLAPVIQVLIIPLQILAAVLGFIVDVFAWVIEKISEFVGWIKETVPAVKSLIGEVLGLGKATDEVSVPIDDVTRAARELANALITEAMPSFWKTGQASEETGKSLSKNFWAGARSAADSMGWLARSTEFEMRKADALVAESTRLIRLRLSGEIGTGSNAASNELRKFAEQARANLNRAADHAWGAIGSVAKALNSGNFFGSGARIGDDFARGIRSKQKLVEQAAAAVAAAARKFFPSSPAKAGPFSGKGYVTYSGRKLVTDFSRSMVRELPQVRRAVAAIQAETREAFQTPVGSGGYTPVYHSYQVRVETSPFQDEIAVGREVDRVLNKFKDASGRR